MNEIERLIWANVFASSWEDPETAIQSADNAVLTLRAAVHGCGRLHIDDSLEGERLGREEKNVKFAERYKSDHMPWEKIVPMNKDDG